MILVGSNVIKLPLVTVLYIRLEEFALDVNISFHSPLSHLNSNKLRKLYNLYNMQLSTTVIGLISAFVASSAAVDTLSFTTSTCAGCSTEPGCSVEQRGNLPADRCISIFSGDQSLTITARSNPNCKGKLLVTT
jgi:hypothetical protein